MKIAILYYSKSGHTLNAAKAIAEGIKSQGSDVDIINVNNLEPPILKIYDGVIFGSPCWAGSISKNGIASPVKKALKKLPDNALKGKLAGGYSIHAGKGGNTTLKSLEQIINTKGCKDFIAGPVGKAGTPFSIGKGPSLSKEDLTLFTNYGKTFAK